MYPTILDLDTHRTHTLTEQEASVFQWCENNHACDCNRSLFVGRHMGLTEDEVNRFAIETDGACVSRRFVIVDAHGDLEGRSVEDIVREGNATYPADAQQQAWTWRRAQESLALQDVLREVTDQTLPAPKESAPRSRL